VKLTVAQEKAVTFSGRNLQLIACAGSGKTEVVARRVRQLLTPGRSQTLLPRNIIAFTFTDKAAAELKERIVTRTRESLGDIPGMAEMFVGTIHAFCLELLKNEIPKYLKYEVLNEVQQTLFVDRHSKASGLTQSTTLNGQPLKRYTDTRHYIAALNILREDRPLAPDRLEGNTVVAQLPRYEQLLHDRGYLDYSGILKEAVAELKCNQDLRERLAARVRHLIVDEYQDVNPVQETVVEELYGLGAGICVVGDDDQTIYQWRGSDIRNILSFEARYQGAMQVRLEDNYRSSEGVVAVAREFIRQVVRRLPKEMKTTQAQDYQPGDITALPFDTPEDEARHIAQTCQTLRGVAIRDDDSERGLSWSDMAILLRSVRRDGEAIMAALEEVGVPYVITGMDDLFQTAEAEAARQLFYFLADEVDEATLRTAWQAADLGIAPDAMDRAVAAAVRARQEMGEAEVGQFKVYNLQRQFIAFLENAGLREERVPGGRGEVVFYNLGKFSQAISDFESIHFHSDPVQKYASFAGFLRHHAESAYPEGWQDNAFVSPDAVRIMTVHQSKGLEWPVVFVPQLVRNRFPSRAGGGAVLHGT
jgi:DNA helicase-2/ATP-dependent DNA helicase PcrA